MSFFGDIFKRMQNEPTKDSNPKKENHDEPHYTNQVDVTYGKNQIEIKPKVVNENTYLSNEYVESIAPEIVQQLIKKYSGVFDYPYSNKEGIVKQKFFSELLDMPVPTLEDNMKILPQAKVTRLLLNESNIPKYKIEYEIILKKKGSAPKKATIEPVVKRLQKYLNDNASDDESISIVDYNGYKSFSLRPYDLRQIGLLMHFDVDNEKAMFEPAQHYKELKDDYKNFESETYKEIAEFKDNAISPWFQSSSEGFENGKSLDSLINIEKIGRKLKSGHYSSDYRNYLGKDNVWGLRYINDLYKKYNQASDNFISYCQKKLIKFEDVSGKKLDF